jgi:hypothetical protein
MAETRTWVFAAEVAEMRLETEPQAVGTHQENGLWNYEHAPGCTQAAKTVANPVPSDLARVVSGNRTLTTLGGPNATDVFVVAADDIAGMNAAQIAQRLTIPPANTFTVVTFPTPAQGLASPILRTNPGFVQGGLTAGGAREFVLPNGPIPAGATTTVVP